MSPSAEVNLSNDRHGADVGRLDGKSVLITGASGGLGSAIARDLASRGAQLTLVARDVDRLKSLNLPGTAFSFDLRDPVACDAAVRAAVDTSGGLDVVVNALGIVAFGGVDEVSTEVIEDLFMTNTFAPIAVSKAAIASMNDGGVIVNISGVIAEQNLPGMAAYGASKAALRSFDEAFSREAKRRKVRVIDARPPHTETGLATRAIAGQPPRMPTGLDPALVASVICNAIVGDATDLGSASFN